MKGSLKTFFGKYFILVLSLAFLGSCIPEIEKQIDKNLNLIKNHKPVYLTKTIPYSQIGRYETQEDAKKLFRSMKMDIRNIDAAGFPDSVIVKAIVYDSSGRSILGLAPPYLKEGEKTSDYWVSLSDSCLGEKIEPENFSVTEIRSSTSEKYAISFILDQSGSMGDKKVTRLLGAVKYVLGAIKPGDYVSVIKFASEIANQIELTNDPDIYRKTSLFHEKKNIGGGTSLYDAAVFGINELGNAPEGYKKVIVLFTDGLDGGSSASLDSVKIESRKHGVTIHTIAYGIGMANYEPMNEMAQYTNGKFYHILSTKEFPFVFKDIYISMNNYYRIVYKAFDCKSLHHVDLGLKIEKPELVQISASGAYDKSVFTQYDPVGTLQFVNIEFDYDEADIKKESIPKLKDIAQALKNHPKLKILIAGHTDSDGDADYNLKLSRKRAFSVKNELIKMGVNEKMLVTKGFGETRNIVPNDTEENKRKNRRTEFKVIGRIED